MDAALTKSGGSTIMLSNYRPASEWSEVNRHAAERPVKVSPELFRLLAACVEYSRQSEGRVRHYGRPADEGLGILQGLGPFAAPGGNTRRL